MEHIQAACGADAYMFMRDAEGNDEAL
jgi:hypothetical protein